MPYRQEPWEREKKFYALKRIPDDCILHDLEPIGAPDGIKRWRSSDKKIYTWDKLHGEIEVFNKRGRHIEVLYPDGSHKSKAIKGRRIDV